MKHFLAGLLLATACGDNSGFEKLVIDGSRTQVLAVHDGFEWQTLELDEVGRAEIDIDGPRLVATVCEETGFGGSFTYATVGVGLGQEVLPAYCRAKPATALLAIDAPATTQVSIGRSVIAGGLGARVESGTFDVIAIDTSLTPPRIEIRRDVTVSADTTMVFDLATTGTPMTNVRVTVTGTADETPTVAATARIGTPTGLTSARWTTDPASVWVVPVSLRRAGDDYDITASTSTSSESSRFVSHAHTGEAAVTLSLPASITTANVTLGASPSLTWGPQGGADQVYFGINTPSFDRVWDATLLPSWTASGGDPTTITIPSPKGIEGWKSSWTFPFVTAGFEWRLNAIYATEADVIRATRTGTL